MIRKGITLIVMLLFIGLVMSPSSTTKIASDMNYSSSQNLNYNITNITAQEAYVLLTDLGGGVQIPIDVRTIGEWRAERIDTPFPEHPRWYPWYLIQSDNITKFLWQYEGCDIIVYGNGGYRDWEVSKDIDKADFCGNIYLMFGGITEWKNKGLPTTPGGIYNLTVNQTCCLLSDILDGKQTPADVRIWEEWCPGFIDTPWPECPIFYDSILYGVELFMAKHIGEELIFYGLDSHQSLITNYKFYNSNFTGTQYNMEGGITEWQKYHLIRRRNTAPATPAITGPNKLRTKKSYLYNFTANDAEGDGICFFISWGDNTTEWTEISDDYAIQVSHTFYEKRTDYNISAYAKDFYDYESGWGHISRKTYTNSNYIMCFSQLFNRFPILMKILDVLRLNIR